MEWVLILLQLLPGLIDLITKILAAIKKKPLAERPALRRELRQTARKCVVKQRGKDVYKVKHDVEPEAELQAFLERVQK